MPGLRELEQGLAGGGEERELQDRGRSQHREQYAQQTNRRRRKKSHQARELAVARAVQRGLVLSLLATVCGFGLIWHIWWLASASFVALVVYAIWHSFNYDRDFHISAEEVAATEHARTEQLKNVHV